MFFEEVFPNYAAYLLYISFIGACIQRFWAQIFSASFYEDRFGAKGLKFWLVYGSGLLVTYATGVEILTPAAEAIVGTVKHPVVTYWIGIFFTAGVLGGGARLVGQVIGDIKKSGVQSIAS